MSHLLPLRGGRDSHIRWSHSWGADHPCGFTTRATYDRSLRRWRHLDLGATKLLLEAEIRRLDCRRCGRVRTEEVPWARPGARLFRDLEDLIAWCAQRMDKTTASRLLGISWATPAALEHPYRTAHD